MADSLKYRRVVLKLSGESFAHPGHFGLDGDSLAATTAEIAEALSLGAQLALVVGGGNMIRGRDLQDDRHIDRVSADTMGMLATTINALALRDYLASAGIDARAMGTVTTAEVCEPFIQRKALSHLKHGRVVVLAGGTGKPFFTTDTCAALRAAELSAEVMLKGTKVDGVYADDPAVVPNAKRYDRLSYTEVIEKRLGVMDLTAVSMCMDSGIPMIVFKTGEPGTLARVLRGDHAGTLIGA